MKNLVNCNKSVLIISIICFLLIIATMFGLSFNMLTKGIYADTTNNLYLTCVEMPNSTQTDYVCILRDLTDNNVNDVVYTANSGENATTTFAIIDGHEYLFIVEPPAGYKAGIQNNIETGIMYFTKVLYISGDQNWNLSVAVYLTTTAYFGDYTIF